ncbi:hypothetical protein ACFX2G_028826 [Malus domestica]
MKHDKQEVKVPAIPTPPTFHLLCYLGQWILVLLILHCSASAAYNSSSATTGNHRHNSCGSREQDSSSPSLQLSPSAHQFQAATATAKSPTSRLHRSSLAPSSVLLTTAQLPPTPKTAVKRLAGREALPQTPALRPSSSFPTNPFAKHPNLYRKKYKKKRVVVHLAPREQRGMVDQRWGTAPWQIKSFWWCMGTMCRKKESKKKKKKIVNK